MVRTVGTKHELPKNPTYKSFERSDGDQKTWPTNTTRIIDHEGHVNYMDPVTLDMPIAIKWRIQVGEALGNALGWPSKSCSSPCSPINPYAHRGSLVRPPGLAKRLRHV